MSEINSSTQSPAVLLVDDEKPFVQAVAKRLGVRVLMSNMYWTAAKLSNGCETRLTGTW
jgi:hypothetical protein